MCEGAAALHQPAVLEVRRDRPQEGDRVDAPVPMETGVLRGDHRVQEKRRDVGERHIGSLAERQEALAIVRVYFRGRLPGGVCEGGGQPGDLLPENVVSGEQAGEGEHHAGEDRCDQDSHRRTRDAPVGRFHGRPGQEVVPGRRR